MTKSELTQAIKEIDVCMMTTLDGRGTFHSRPMSNNKEVESDADTYFFTMKDTQKVRDLMESPRVSLTYQGKKGLFVQVYGEGHLIEQKGRMEERWSDDLNAWFRDGLQTDGLCMIRVEGKWMEYWQREKNGRLTL